MNLITQSKFFTGITNLIKDLTGAASIILFILAGLMLTIIALKKLIRSGDDHDHSSGMSLVGKVLLWCVIGGSASAIINIILAYFAA